MVLDTDILISGGGPAGLCAGIVLARQGLRTIICERRAYPIDKVCGQGIMPTGVADLKALGISRYLPVGSYYPFKGISYHSRCGDIAVSSFSEGAGWGMQRPVLSGALRRCAEAVPNLTVMSDVGVVALTRDLDGTTVKTSDGRRLKTRLLVGADGLNSKIRTWSGLDGAPQKLNRWGARQHYRSKPWSECVEVHWKDGVEAYVTPCGENLVEIAFLWGRDLFKDVAGGRALIPSLLSNFPELQDRVVNCEVNDDPKAVGPLSRAASSPVDDGILLIGDAAGYLDAITGEGIGLATRQSLALAETVGPLLLNNAGNIPSKAELQDYRRAYQKIVRPYGILTRAVLFLTKHPALATRTIRALGDRPDVFQTLLSINMGNIPTVPRLFATAVKLATGFLACTPVPERR